MGGLGTTEIIVIAAILILLFGASKIPELARGVGEGINEFRKASEKELDDDKKNEKNNDSDSQKEQSDAKEVKTPKN